MSQGAEGALLAMAATATAPIWVPVYVVYLLAKGTRSGIKGTYRAGQRFYAAYSSKEEAERAARQAVQEEGGETEAAVLEAEPSAIVREYKHNSAANRVTEYNIIMKKPHTNGGLNNSNLAYRNAHQNNMMDFAYGNKANAVGPWAAPAPAPAPSPAPSRWGWFGKRGGSRSKRSTKRSRNAKRSSSTRR